MPPVGQPAAAAKPLDMNALTKDAEAIRAATGNDNWVARWADKTAINNILQDKSDSERQAIDQLYRGKFHIGLVDEMRKFQSGSDLDTFLNIFQKQDGNNKQSERASSA